MKSKNLFGLQVLVRVVVGLTKAPKKWQYSILYVYRLAHLAKTAKIIQLLFCVQIHEHSNSPLVYSGGRVARSLVFCVVYIDHCLYFFLAIGMMASRFQSFIASIFTVSDYLCQVWYLQTFLVKNHEKNGFVKCVTDHQTAI